MLNIGYHPKCWRQATGAILAKPNKPDYTVPKAYRPIALLNCLGKVAEKIIAARLNYLAEKHHLLDPEQMGGRKQRSATDAALALIHDVEVARSEKQVMSVLFLDVKGAFDNVSKSRLLGTLHDLGLPSAILQWVKYFMSDRLVALAFDGQREDLAPVETSIPQGSPTSPILFLLYISSLFKELK